MIQAFRVQRRVVVAIVVVSCALLVACGEPRDQVIPGALRPGTSPATALLQDVAATLAQLEPEGARISGVVLEQGIRADDGEVARDDEVKVMFNLDWESLPEGPPLEPALAKTMAHVVIAVMDAHPAITKLRVIIKVEKSGLRPWSNKGAADGHGSIAKLFSMTRPAYALARANGLDGRDPAALLGFGDYVILGESGWVRGAP